MSRYFGLTAQGRHVTGWKIGAGAKNASCSLKLLVALCELTAITIYGLLWWFLREPMHFGFFVATIYAAGIAFLLPLFFEDRSLHLQPLDTISVHLLHIACFTHLYFVLLSLAQVKLGHYVAGQDPFAEASGEAGRFTLYTLAMAAVVALIAVSLLWRVAWACTIVGLVVYLLTHQIHVWVALSVGTVAMVLAGLCCGMVVLNHCIARWSPSFVARGNAMDISRHLAASYALTFSAFFVHEQDSWLERYIHGHAADYAWPLAVGTIAAIARVAIDAASLPVARDYANGQELSESVSSTFGNDAPAAGASDSSAASARAATSLHTTHQIAADAPEYSGADADGQTIGGARRLLDAQPAPVRALPLPSVPPPASAASASSAAAAPYAFRYV
ncbi:MAG: hypothetical protein KF742_01750 [Cryobacterium sp.]|nr:hypothetical protein [Cryobacterium sp.]